MVNDPAVLLSVKKFLRVETIPNYVKIVENNADLLSCLQNDAYAIGFCNLTGIMVPALNHFADKVNILPIDKNGNGKLDQMENIYSDPETFSRGVWIGKYPKSLINDIYAVSPTQPDGTAQIAFLSWILTEGQEALSSYGFNELVYSEVQSKLDKIEIAPTGVTMADTAVSFPKLALFIIAAVLFIGIIVSAIFGLKREEVRYDVPEVKGPGSSFREKSITAPGGLFYDKSHTWAFMEKDGTVKVGIDDFIQHVAGRITRVEMRGTGEKVKRGDAFLTLIQKGKRLKLYAPVSGTIVECNRILEYEGYTMNSSPYADGWIYRIEPASWLQEIPLLSMAGKYTKWLSEEFNRLKDFLAGSMQSRKLEYAHVVMQDGGEMKDNLLEDFGPEVWEDFQHKFIDNIQ
jgi:glycine cleavage system H lipoate-binding protein